VRYALHRYFARKYGWHLRGLEPGGAWNSSTPATIMKDRAPSYIMEMFEQRLHGRGLGLKELVIFAVTLSDLVHKEAVSDLEDVFAASGHSKSAGLSDRAMAKLLKTYLMTYITGVHNWRNGSMDFDKMELTMESDIIVWFDAKMWAEDLRRSHFHTKRSCRSPFVNEFNFDDAAEAAVEMGRHFGAFQNMECKALKAKLVDMEHGGSGRVTLTKFYSGCGQMDWPFIESVDYLRNLGALDDSDPLNPSVIIPNFLSSPSNCEAPSNFYSVCCIDECEGLLAEVEAAVAGPSATVPRLVDIISNLQSDTVAAPRNLSVVQVTRLNEIADHHGGRVPLHGRLFSQWMHHMYPRECRFPHVAGSTTPLPREEFASKFGLGVEVTDDELAQYVENNTQPEPVAVTLPWSSAEELIASYEHIVEGDEAKQSRWSPLRLLALAAVVVSTAFPVYNARKHSGMVVVDKQERHLV